MVSEAIQAGIFNDLGSGSNVDMVVISKTSGTEVLRNIVKPNERPQKSRTYNTYPAGTAIVIKETVETFPVPTDPATPMEIS